MERRLRATRGARPSPTAPRRSDSSPPPRPRAFCRRRAALSKRRRSGPVANRTGQNRFDLRPRNVRRHATHDRNNVARQQQAFGTTVAVAKGPPLVAAKGYSYQRSRCNHKLQPSGKPLPPPQRFSKDIVPDVVNVSDAPLIGYFRRLAIPRRRGGIFDVVRFLCCL